MMIQERLLITGVGGMEGRVLAQLACQKGPEKGIEVFGIYHKKLPPEIKDLEERGSLRLCRVDLSKTDETRKVFSEVRPDKVIHLAGHALDNPNLGSRVYADNMGIFRNVLSGIDDSGGSSRLILASSIVVYGRPENDTPIIEVATELLPEPNREREFYRSSKVDQERELAASGLDHAIVRPSQHIGAGRIPNVVEVDIANEIMRVRRHETDRIEVRNKLAEIDMLDARDVAWAYLIVNESGIKGEIYNVASGFPIDVEFLAQRLVEADGLPQIQVVSTKNEQVTYCRISSKKLRALGWQPQYKLDDGLMIFLQDHKSTCAGFAAGTAYSTAA